MPTHPARVRVLLCLFTYTRICTHSLWREAPMFILVPLLPCPPLLQRTPVTSLLPLAPPSPLRSSPPPLTGICSPRRPAQPQQRPRTGWLWLPPPPRVCRGWRSTGWRRQAGGDCPPPTRWRASCIGWIASSREGGTGGPLRQWWWLAWTCLWTLWTPPSGRPPMYVAGVCCLVGAAAGAWGMQWPGLVGGGWDCAGGQLTEAEGERVWERQPAGGVRGVWRVADSPAACVCL